MDVVLLCWTALGESGLAASIIVREYSEKWITDFPSIQESGMPQNGSCSTKWNSGKSRSRRNPGISLNSVCLKFTCLRKGNLKVILTVLKLGCKVYFVLKG